MATEIITIETRGDVILDVAISKIGSKGVFTEEIEDRLSDGSIDIAVHSAKDMLSVLPDPLKLIAFTKRERPNDVVVSIDKGVNLATKGIRIGTASARRHAFVRHYYPEAEIIPVRGNVQTRIARMYEGACDVLILAHAGITRLGFETEIAEQLDTSYFIPPVGQGSIAIEARADLDVAKHDAVRVRLNDTATEICVKTERAFLRKLEGGCSIPAFGFAVLRDDDVSLTAGILSEDGNRLVQFQERAPRQDGEKLGLALAEKVLSHGGYEILRDLRKLKNS